MGRKRKEKEKCDFCGKCKTELIKCGRCSKKFCLKCAVCDNIFNACPCRVL